jgi:hypothetical protein
MKKTVGIIFLTIWFAWSTISDLTNLIGFSGTTDYYVFSVRGLTLLYLAFLVFMLAFDAATVYSLLRPSKTGFYTGLTSLVVALIENIISISIALSNLQGVREAYIRSREMRGLFVKEDFLERVFTPQGMYITLIILVGLYLTMAFLIVRNRNYFLRNQTND